MSSAEGLWALNADVGRTRREKVSKTVARLIVREIADSQLAAGSPLPSEQLMAQQYGVGRTTVREALRVLEAQGLVVIRPGVGGGPVVGSPSGSDFGQTMTMFLQVQGTPVREALEAVVHFESIAAELAASRVFEGSADESDVSALAAAGERDLREPPDFIQAGAAFHVVVRRIAANAIVSLVTEAVDHVFAERARGRAGARFDTAYRASVHDDHVRIGRAIAKGKVDQARRLMHEHMQRQTDYVAESSPGLLDETIEWR